VILPLLFPGKIWVICTLVLLQSIGSIWPWIHQALGSL
jgi:hypothetical protein